MSQLDWGIRQLHQASSFDKSRFQYILFLLFSSFKLVPLYIVITVIKIWPSNGGLLKCYCNKTTWRDRIYLTRSSSSFYMHVANNKLLVNRVGKKTRIPCPPVMWGLKFVFPVFPFIHLQIKKMQQLLAAANLLTWNSWDSSLGKTGYIAYCLYRFSLVCTWDQKDI